MRHRWLLAILLVSASGVQAQDTTAIKGLTARTKQDMDSIVSGTKLTGSQVQKNNRAESAVRARQDSIVAAARIPVTPPVDTTPKVASVTISSAGTNVAVGATLQLYAQSKDAAGNVLPMVVVKWRVDDTTKANMRADGLLTGKAAGSVNAIATAQTPDSVKGVRTYSVTAIVPPDTTPKPPIGIAINPGQAIQSFVDANPGATTFILKAGRHVRQDVRPKTGNTFRGEGSATILDGENATVRAFRGHNGGSWVNNVKLVNFVITKYAPPAQSGAVWGGDDNTASTDGWVLDSMDINHNANLGVRVGHRMKVLRSKVSYNTTINIGGAGKGILIDSSEFNFGNQGCPNNPGFESGGSKFVVTDSLIVRNSTFSDNCGVGLWLDINNRRYQLHNNLIERNIREGIAVEVGYGGKIFNNRVNENGHPTDPFRGQNWLWDAGIGIHAVDSVEVYGNILRENFNGIAIVQQRRENPPETYGPPPPGYLARDNWIHDNIIIQKNPQGSGFENSVGGAVQDYTYSPDVFNRNNKWDRNTYCVAGRARPFTWMGGWRTWAEWRSYGQDPNGTVDGPSCGTTGAAWTHPYPALSNNVVYAEFPRDSVSLVVPAPIRTINVTSLQAALDTAKTDDRLLIPANHITANLYVRPTARALWVTIQGTDSTSVITGTIGGAESAVNVVSKAHHVRFLGPLTINQSIPVMNALFRSYNGETSVADAPHHIILDGVTIKVRTDQEARRCAWPDGAYMAIVRSRLIGCATKSGDAQAIIIGNGPGPYRFENNYLEGSHQCFMSGGFDPAIPNMIPSDVVFSGNTCFKPLYWHYVGSPGNYPDSARQVKTIVETKNIRRALFQYNVLRNVWGDAQAGFCGLFKSENQNGTASWTQTVDVTFRYNRCVNVHNGINISAGQGNAPSVPLARFTAYGNLIDTVNTASDAGISFQYLGAHQDVVIMHNTVTAAGNSAGSFDGAPASRLSIVANNFKNGMYGFKGSGQASGNGTLNYWLYPTGLFTTNIVDGGGCSTMPAGTLCTTPNPLPIAPDGTPIGADLTKIPK